MRVIEVAFAPMRKVAQIQIAKALLDVARETGVMIRADCGGIGICGKCLVRVLAVEGEVTQPTANEVKILGVQRLSEGYRLACQLRIVRGRVEVYVPPESLVQRYRSADIGLERSVPLNPAIRVYNVNPPKPSLSNPQPDLDRIVTELEKIGVHVDVSKTPLNVLRILPEVVREANWNLDVVLWNDRIVDIRPHNDLFKPVGVAVDVGTSRVVVHLVSLRSGETLAIESMSNPQASYGADIISRLTYAIQSDENLLKLQTTIINTINTLIKRVAERTSMPLDWIYEIVIVGNTVMHHLLLGIKPKHLGLAPYTPAIRGPLDISPRELNININSNGVAHLPPVVAGFVGSDAIADAVAVNIDECPEPCVLIDIGTNTEIIINTGKKIVAGSTPAGPAFEGATTAFGMRAIEGAIDQVFIYFDKSLDDYVVRYNVIGGRRPSGMCGSGYIDLVANLYRLGLLNKKGKFVNNIKSSRFVKENDVLKFVVAKADETSINRDIAVDEKDVDGLLLAKAAVISGLKMLLNYVGIDVNDVSKIFVAGSFGSYLNIENAITIGLLPNIPIHRYIFVGNASISGAKAILKSRELREKASRLAKSIEYVEIAAHPEYRKIFIGSLYLP